MVSRILLEIAHQFYHFNHPLSPINVINQNSWRNLIGTLHYLGGSPERADSNGFPSDPNVKSFLISQSNCHGFYDKSSYNGNEKDISIPNAQFEDFIPNTISCLKDFRKSNENSLLVTMKELKDYLIQCHPLVAKILQNIAKGPIDSEYLRVKHNNHPPYPLYNVIVDDENVPDLAAFVIGQFLMGEATYLICDLSDIGIVNSDAFPDTDREQLILASQAFINLHFPSNDFIE